MGAIDELAQVGRRISVIWEAVVHQALPFATPRPLPSNSPPLLHIRTRCLPKIHRTHSGVLGGLLAPDQFTLRILIVLALAAAAGHSLVDVLVAEADGGHFVHSCLA